MELLIGLMVREGVIEELNGALKREREDSGDNNYADADDEQGEEDTGEIETTGYESGTETDKEIPEMSQVSQLREILKGALGTLGSPNKKLRRDW